MAGRVRVGVGGWTFAPWRKTFFPPGLPAARELAYASQRLTAIEVNGTFYRTQSPSTFRRWAAETPDDFVFALKAPGYVVNRRVLAETGEGVTRFMQSGLTELGHKLGPILWQFSPTRRFDAADVAAFLELLPEEVEGVQVRHALEVRHESFCDPRFLALARQSGVAVVYAESDTHPGLADLTGSFVYARLQRSREAEPLGYSPAALTQWATRARLWSAGGDPADLPHILAPDAEQRAPTPRPVFIFFISAAKIRNPAAAQALIAELAA